MTRRAGVSRLCKPLATGLIFAFAVWASFAEATAAAESLAVPGTTVTMTPPDGFVPATNFSGFVNLEKKASLFVAELPAEAIGQLSALFGDQEAAAKSLATKGITLTASEEIETTNGKTVTLLHGTQEANGLVLDKWMALYGGEKTVLITFQIPQANALDRRTLKSVFASVSTGSAPPIYEKLSVLPFEIAASEPFRIVDTLGGSSVVMLAGNKDVDPEGLQPMIIVAVSLTSEDRSNLAAAAEHSLRLTTGFEAAEVISREETTFAGMNGFLMKGNYDDRGIRKTFIQYFGAEGDRAIRLIGSADEGKFDVLQGSIEKIAASVAFKD